MYERTDDVTYESFPANLLDERVDHFSEYLEGYLRAADLGGVAVHARLPCSTLRLHGRDPALSAEVCLVREVTLRNILHNLHGVLRHAVLDVALDHEEELGEDVQCDRRQRPVEKHLHISNMPCS